MWKESVITSFDAEVGRPELARSPGTKLGLHRNLAVSPGLAAAGDERGQGPSGKCNVVIVFVHPTRQR